MLWAPFWVFTQTILFHVHKIPTEKTDATAIVVSEETGNISVAKGDTIKLVTPSELEAELTQAFGMEAVVPEESKQ